MATNYVILREHARHEDSNAGSTYEKVDEVHANTSEAATKATADAMTDEEIGDGVTLIAIPARNWRTGRHTWGAETKRKLTRT